MADELPLFPKATSMYLHSGNMINWNRLKRRPNLSSSDELCEVIADTLNAYVEAADKTELQYVTEVYKVKSENVEVIEESERGDVKITVKVFICDSQPPSVIGDAVTKVLNELGTTFIETLLLAVGPTGGEDHDPEEVVSLSTVEGYWKAMEELVANDKVLSLGICDFGKEGLEALYNWAQVKPCVDQVNLESCCVLPKDLTEYAKSINVQLLTHNDRPAFITKELLQEKMQSVTTERDSDAWTPEWVVRYSGILKCRGIIKTKGYIFHAARDNKKRIL